MTPAARFYLFGNALALCVGTTIVHFHKPAPYWALLLIGLLIYSVSYQLWLSPPSTEPTKPATAPPLAFIEEADPATMPRYNSRRWARACYHNGIITLEELQAFYNSHPHSLSDPDR